MSSGTELPSGTVTFLFTDIEGSTRLVQQLGASYADVLGRHQAVLRAAVADHSGREVDTQGDSFFIAFRRATDAVLAAIDAQRALAGEAWPEGGAVRVRMGIHTGEPLVGDERYVGIGVHRAARIAAIGHGGQILVSQATRELLRDDPPPDVSLLDLDEHQLKGIAQPERVYQLVAPGLASAFAPLKTSAPATRRWSRRRLGVATGAIVIAAVVGLIVLTRGHSGTAHAAGPLPANSLGVVDERSGKIVAEIPVGQSPSGVAVGEGSYWVTNTDDQTVSRIDPKSNEVVQTIKVGAGPAGVAVGGGAVWVANALDGTISRIDPATNDVVQTIRVGAGPIALTFGSGALWVVNSTDGTVSRIDATPGKVAGVFPAGFGASGIASGGGAIWVTSYASGTLRRLDLRTGATVATINVGDGPRAVSTGTGGVWVANALGATVSRVDPRTNQVAATVPLGDAPSSVATAANGTWVATRQTGSLTLLRADGTVARTLHLGNRLAGMALDGDKILVAVRSSGAEHRGGTLRATTGCCVDTIDPTLAYDPFSWSILSGVYDGLVTFERTGGSDGTKLVPDLATAIPTPTDGGLTYTFQLRPGILYSDGSPVRARDFRRALERLFSVPSPDGHGAPYANFYANLVGGAACTKRPRGCDVSRGVVTDDAARTVTFHLARADSDFLYKLALPAASALPSNMPAHDVGAHPAPGTGPYSIVRYRRGRELTLTRNPRFHEWSAAAQPAGYPDRIVVSFGGTQSAATAAVANGRADYTDGVEPPARLRELQTRFAAQLHTNPTASTWYFVLNVTTPPFDDIRVRRALNHAVDRNAFITPDLAEGGTRPTCQVLPPNFPGFQRYCPYGRATEDGSPSEPDLPTARRLIRASGTRGTAVTVWAPTFAREQSAYLVRVLALLGYRATLHIVPFDDYFAKVNSPRVQVGFYGWVADYPAGSNFIGPLFTCAEIGKTNGSRFCDPAFDRRVARALDLQSRDPGAANASWARLDREVVDRALIVPMLNPGSTAFVSKRVGNVQYNPQWGTLLDQLWVK